MPGKLLNTGNAIMSSLKVHVMETEAKEKKKKKKIIN